MLAGKKKPGQSQPPQSQLNDDWSSSLNVNNPVINRQGSKKGIGLVGTNQSGVSEFMQKKYGGQPSLAQGGGHQASQQISSQYEYEYNIPAGNKALNDSMINTSAGNIIAGGGIIGAGSNAYNMSFISNHEGQQHPPSRSVGTRKMMAAVASGVIEETSPHSSKHELILANPNAGAGMYRKRF